VRETPTAMTKPLPGMLFLFLLACNSAKRSDRGLDSGIGDQAISGSMPDSEAAIFEPAWWRLSAALRVVAGQLAAGGSELEVAVLDRDGIGICTEFFLVESTNTEPTSPDPAILVWWSIERGEGSGECAAYVDLSVLPRRFFLGVGELHPELVAVAGRLEEIPASGTTTLNGAYARLDSGVDDVWVYGFAGDEAAWDGRSGPAMVAPLADGTWTLAGYYGFPLP